MFVYILYRSVNHFLCPRDLVWRWLGLHSWRPELAGIIPYRVVIRFPEKDGDKHPLPDFVSQRTVQDKVGKTLGTVSDSLKKTPPSSSSLAGCIVKATILIVSLYIYTWAFDK